MAQPQNLEMPGPERNLADFLLVAAQEVPDKICIETEAKCYTYAQMARMIQAVRDVLRRFLDRCPEVIEAAEDSDSAETPAFHLRRPDEHVVCIVLDRGPECLVAVHATMLEGCVYNTFDAAEPREKLKTWVEIAEHPVMITSRPVMDRLGLTEQGWTFGGDFPRFVMDIDQVLKRACGKADLPVPAPSSRADDPNRLCYVIFTSGSTGKPKAVMIEHRSACNLVRVWSGFVGLQPDHRIAQMASMAFDNHVCEIYGALNKRCTSVVVPDLMKRSGPDMIGWLNSKMINLMVTVPSHLRSMSGAGNDVSPRVLPHLQRLDIGGEALGRDVLDTWAPGRHLFNIYGPTEMTVVCAGIRVEPGDEITIGRDLPTYRNYVLNQETLQPCAVGERGVLYSGGVGTARGYLDDEAKTSGKFLQVPGLGRLYCSGDVCSLDASGRFHYHGRADWQVKVRGIRIELEALEEAVGNVPGVKHCEARVIENGTKLVIIVSGQDLDERVIKEAALKLGKGYQLNLVKVVDHSAWKFNTSGKLVRNVVPLEEQPREEGAAARSGWDGFDQEDTTELQRDVAGCVAQLTTSESWDVNSHFIEDLGLDSAGFGKLITIMRRIPALQAVDLPTLFENPTVSALARVVESRSKEDDEAEGEPLGGEGGTLFDLVLARCSPDSGGSPHALFVESPNGSVTYGHSQKRALALQVLLRRSMREAGSRPKGDEGVVVLLLEGKSELLVAMAAVLLEQLAFCYLDPSAPFEQLVEQINLVGPCAIVTDEATSEAVKLADMRSKLAASCALVNSDSAAALLSKPLPQLKRPRWRSPFCCVSMAINADGKPTAVRFEHAAIHWAAQAWQGLLGIQPSDRVALMLAPGSIAAVTAMWACCSAGASLLFPPAQVKPGRSLHDWLHSRHATVLGAAPGCLRVLGSSPPPSLRVVWSSGLSCRGDLASHWATRCRFVFAYSWPEVAAACGFDIAAGALVRQDKMVPLGRELPGGQLHVLDDNMKPVPSGQSGRLYIGGSGLASGYFDAVRGEGFVQLPQLGRLFRTTQTVRRSLDGEVELVSNIGAVFGRSVSANVIETLGRTDSDLLPLGPVRSVPTNTNLPPASASRLSMLRTQFGGTSTGTFSVHRRQMRLVTSLRYYIVEREQREVQHEDTDPFGEDAWVLLCTAVQTAYSVVELMGSVVYLVVSERFILPYTLRASLLYSFLLLAAAAAAQQILLLVWVLVAKWVLIGRYKEGDYAIYSMYYLKHWIVDRAASRTILGQSGAQGGWNFNVGRNFIKILLLKMLGMDVSLSAMITARITGFDLVHVGPLASVHGPHHLTAVSFVGKRMLVASHHIGRGATVCHGSCVSAGSTVMDNAFVEPLTSVPYGSSAEGRWSGVPGRQVGPAARPKDMDSSDSESDSESDSSSAGGSAYGGGSARERSAERRLVCAGALFAFGNMLLVPLNLLLMFGGLWLARWLIDDVFEESDWYDKVEAGKNITGIPPILHAAEAGKNITGIPPFLPEAGKNITGIPPILQENLWVLLAGGALYAIVNELLTLLVPILVCRLLPKVRPPMDVPIYSWRALVANLKISMASKGSEELGDASIQAFYLGLCGAKMGRGSSMSEQTMLPETVEVGERCFFASGNTLTSLEVDQGRMRIPCKTIIGDAAFLGNENHIAEGIQPNTFVGIRTWVPTMPSSGGSLFGNPAMKFGRPAVSDSDAQDGTVCQKVWHHVSTSLIDPFLWKALQYMTIGLSFTLGRTVFPNYGANWGWKFLVEVMLFAAVRLGSWLLVAVFFCNLIYNDRMPLQSPYYSTVITRWFNANKIRKVFKKPIYTSGTVYDAFFMRLIGIHVGKRFFSPNEDVMIDPPWGRLGNDITVDYDGQVRQHSFEDDMLKWGPNYIGDSTTILQAGMVAMSDTGQRVMLARGSVTWKGQQLEADTFYEGAPAAPVMEDLGANLWSHV